MVRPMSAGRGRATIGRTSSLGSHAMPSGNTFILEVHPKIPRRLARLEELADNLWYSWDRPTRSLFSRLHTSLWDAVGHSPKAFLKRVDEQRLIAAADDPVFLNSYNRVLSAYDSYKDEPLRRNGSEWLRQNDLIAYFCAEFGFHESLPIYSGGLGILAGDHCKAASDMRLPFVGVGLLYRQGYFSQTIDGDGNQHASVHRFGLLGPADLAGHAPGRRRGVRVPGLSRPADLAEGLAGESRARDALPARCRHRPQRPARSRHHAPPLRRRQGRSHRTGDRARHRRRACARRARVEAHGLAHQRRPRGVPHARTRARTGRPGSRLRHRDGGRRGATPCSRRTRRCRRDTITSRRT